jgi:cyclase
MRLTRTPNFKRAPRACFRGALFPRAAVLLLALALPAAAQQDFSKVEIVTRPVAGVVSELEGSGGNIGVSAGPDGVLIVDAQFEPLAPKILAALDALDGAGPGSPRFVLNTHWHGDHVGGNAALGRDGTIVAHDAVRVRMLAGADRSGRSVPPAAPAALPVVTYADAITLHFNGEEIRVRHLPPGHTDGDSMVWFTKSHVVHLGDQFFAGRFPFVDVGSGGSVSGLERSIAALLEELPADIRLIPGHGPLSTLDDLRTYHRMLETSIRTVQEQLSKGADAKAIVAAGLPAEWDGWSWSFISRDTWLEIVATSLQRDAEAGATTPAAPAKSAAPATPATPESPAAPKCAPAGSGTPR